MELASLVEIAPGRVRASVGTGVPDMIGKLGGVIERPIKQTVALHQALRVALSGGDLTAEYPGFRFDQYKLNTLAQPPALDIMAVRPQMVRAAARYADGVTLSAGSSRDYLAATVSQVEKELAEAGRRREDFRITAVVAAFITDDPHKARNQVAALLSTFDPHTTEYLAAGAIPDGALVTALAEGGPFAAVDVFTPEVIDAIAMVCAPDDLPAALHRYAQTGVDEIAVAPFAPPDQLLDIVRALADSRPPSTTTMNGTI
jgi:alkanesulfonate monooxygenase SsuD/methylene tetrahydromethanopterin reductase-like flavin-dependent oxidoreductase (luciferase family)